MRNKKPYFKVFLQIFLLISFTFSISYILRESSEERLYSEEYEFRKVDLGKVLEFIGNQIFGDNIVSALEQGDLNKGVYTCILSKEGKSCQEYPASECAQKCAGACIPSGKDNVAACKPGTCYDSVEGTCQAGSPQALCSKDGGKWYDDPYENIPQCREGCCIIGAQASFITEKQCLRKAELTGNSKIFKPEIKDEISCLALGQNQEEGACLFDSDFENTCKFTSKSECIKKSGRFYSGKLCSHPLLNTTCKSQKFTGCAEGKDEVYWFDSCGNRENIYSLPKAGSWNDGEILSKDKSCALGSGANPLANQNTCGNCNYLLGSTCKKSDDKQKASVGDFACRDISCIDENGIKRKNGESWCVYQGAIGVDTKSNRAIDTPGSRHFRETCINGEIRTEPCGDYRSEICVESKSKVSDGTFSSAACRINRAQECIGYNFGEKDSDAIKTKCEKNPDCFVKKTEVSDKFKFNVCAPKYPSGFLLDENGRGEGAEAICSVANQKCTYIKVKGLFSSKEINKECLTEKFPEKMNDLCMSLGDCGASVNYIGDYSENYKAVRSDGGEIKLSQKYVTELTKYKNIISGKVAEPGSLESFYGELGIPGFLGTADGPADKTAGVLKMASMTSGMLGVGLVMAAKTAVGSQLLSVVGLGHVTALPAGVAGPTLAPGLTAAGGALAGAAIGVALTSFLLQITGVGKGLEPGIAYSLLGAGAIGGAMAGYAFTHGGTAALASGVGLAGVITIVVVIIVILIMKLLGIGKKTEINVQFQCKPWQPPVGGAKCSECGKGMPCSAYACKSLGQTCEIINEGTGEEKCIDISPNDTSAPIINPHREIISKGHSYSEISENGFKLKNDAVNCLEPYSNVIYGISLNEPGQCKVSTEHTDLFEKMSDNFGISSLFRYNHTAVIPVPDLQSLGLQGYDPNLKADYNFYLRCTDKSGNENIKEYNINFCIKQGVDVTPPIVTRKDPAHESVKFGAKEQEIDIYTNEPSDCKWDRKDKDYSGMSNQFSCSNFLSEQNLDGWKCSGNVSVEKESKVYVRCIDQPWLADKIKNEEGNLIDNPQKNESERNSMKESYAFELKESKSNLKIDSVEPDGKILEFGTEPASVEVIVKTSGGYDGSAECFYKIGSQEIAFLDTWKISHKQVFQSLYSGKTILPIICKDIVGNRAEKTAEFEIKIDTEVPRITRVYVQSGDLKIITDENAVCSASTDIPELGDGECAFDFTNENKMSGEEKVHTISFDKKKTYYIKCKDEFERSLGTDCNMVIKGR